MRDAVFLRVHSVARADSTLEDQLTYAADDLLFEIGATGKTGDAAWAGISVKARLQKTAGAASSVPGRRITFPQNCGKHLNPASAQHSPRGIPA